MVMRMVLPVLVAYAALCGGVLDDANGLYADGRFREAVPAYRRAIAADANPAVAYFNLGNAYYQMDSLAAAIVCYEASAREAPEFHRAWLNLGVLYYSMDDLGEAVAALERARTIEPQDAQSLLTLAAAYGRLQHYQQAVPLLEQVIQADSTQLECYFLLFDICRDLHDVQEAVRWLESYPDQGTRVADKYQLLGELSEEHLGSAEAVFYYRRLVDLAPERKWAHYRLAAGLFGMGNALSAIQQAGQSLKQFPEFAELALLAGNGAMESGMLGQAERFYSRAYKLGRAGGLVGLQNLRELYGSKGNAAASGRISRLMTATR